MDQVVDNLWIGDLPRALDDFQPTERLQLTNKMYHLGHLDADFMPFRLKHWIDHPLE